MWFHFKRAYTETVACFRFYDGTFVVRSPAAGRGGSLAAGRGGWRRRPQAVRVPTSSSARFSSAFMYPIV